MSVFEKAKKRLGLTTDPREAGFILPTGELLDFSGKKLVQPRHRPRMRGTRALDHSEINAYTFREKGAIQISVPRTLKEVDIALSARKRPTKQQLKAISRILRIGKTVTGRRPTVWLDVYGKRARKFEVKIISSQELARSRFKLSPELLGHEEIASASIPKIQRAISIIVKRGRAK